MVEWQPNQSPYHELIKSERKSSGKGGRPPPPIEVVVAGHSCERTQRRRAYMAV
jgi:hypothetical protein